MRHDRQETPVNFRHTEQPPALHKQESVGA